MTQLAIQVIEEGGVEIIEVLHEGPRGVHGDHGHSAYEIAVENGFEGTEAEWLASLAEEATEAAEAAATAAAESATAADGSAAAADTAMAQAQDAAALATESAEAAAGIASTASTKASEAAASATGAASSASTATTQAGLASTARIGAEAARDAAQAAAAGVVNDMASHLAAPNPHGQYLTQDEGDARYAPAGFTGNTDLSIANRSATTLDVVSSTGADATIPAATNTQAGLATAAQVTLIEGAVQGSDARLDDAREWTAATVTQAEAEAGTAITRRAWTAQRVFQAIAAWWAASPAATKLAGIASGATANATDAALRDRQTHTGEQAISTITGLSTALGAKADLVGGVIPTSQIPSVALVEFLGAVANQGALLLLRGQPGDWAVRTDRATTWVIIAGNGASLANWYEMPTGISPVGSVNGQTGSVVLGTGDISESGGNLYFTSGRGESAAASWWAASSAKTKLDGIASGATATPLSDAIPQAPGTAAAGTATSAAREDHVHQLPATVTTSAAGLQPASGYGTVTYAAQVTIDFAARDRQMATISLTGALELLSSNLANGREVRLRLVCDSTQRALTFPIGWKFVCAKPANIAASKVAVLSLAAYGTTNADVVAAYAVQP